MTERKQDEDTHRFSVRVALVAMAMAMTAIVLTALISSGVSIRPFDQGWATFLGAIIGFGALALQSYFSLRSVERSNRDQAVRDRQAREDLRIAEASARLIQWGEERKTLAFALSGELSAAYTRFSNMLPLLRASIEIYRHGGDAPVSIQLHTLLPRLEPSIYLANIGRLGILGPSVVSDVTEVFQTLVNSTRDSQPTTLPSRMVAVAIEANVQAIEIWLRDQVHVQRRLLAIGAAEDDPGALFFERQKRQEPQ